MELGDSCDLYLWLERQDLLVGKPPLWWPAYGTFEVVIGALLTQNTKWEKVERSLQNLDANHLLSLDTLNACDVGLLMEMIQPSGLYKSKSIHLKKLVQAIIDSYGDYDTFKEQVDREWLLSQKGVGPETADSILCYACGRAEMVVDAYTARLLAAFGLDYEAYDDIKEWCSEGLGRVFEEVELAEKYALFHGMIVEYVKANSKGKTVKIDDYS